MNEQILAFWQLYDQYVQTENKDIRPRLSSLLSEIEEKDRRKQLLRPEKGWNTILAWQVLRTQEFIFSDNVIFRLYTGDVLVWEPHWDRDILLTRFPMETNIISGRILKPGFEMTHEDKGELSDYEWNQQIRSLGITNEKGLYLPVYESDTLKKFCLSQIAEMQKGIFSYLGKELNIF